MVRHSVLESSPARYSTRMERGSRVWRHMNLKDLCSVRSGTTNRGSRCSNIDDILENGCISRCSLDKKTGALHLYVRRNRHNNSSSLNKRKPACKKRNLYLRYKPNARRKKPPCSKTPKTQIVKEQNVQTEITISADVDMWQTREYCRCDLRDGRSESPEPCPEPPRSPSPELSSSLLETEWEPSYEHTPPSQEETPLPRNTKRRRKGTINDGRLAFKNYNIAFQKIILNSELPKEMKHLKNYYVTQNPHYKLKFEKRVMRNGVREMIETTRRRSGAKQRGHQHRNRGLLGMKIPEKEDFKLCSKERPEPKVNEGQQDLAWNALCQNMRRCLADDKITERREADRIKRHVECPKEQMKDFNKKKRDKSHKGSDRKRGEISRKGREEGKYEKEKGGRKSDKKKGRKKSHKEKEKSQKGERKSHRGKEEIAHEENKEKESLREQEENKPIWNEQENKCRNGKECGKLHEEREGKKEDKGYKKRKEGKKSHKEKEERKSHKEKGGRKSQKEYRKRLEVEMKKTKKPEENKRVGNGRAVRNNVHVLGFINKYI